MLINSKGFSVPVSRLTKTMRKVSISRSKIRAELTTVKVQYSGEIEMETMQGADNLVTKIGMHRVRIRATQEHIMP